MDDRVLEIVLKARDEATKTIEQVGDNVARTGGIVDKIADQFKRAGTVMIGAGVAGGALMLDWVNKAADAQTEIAKVESIVGNLADSVPGSYTQIMDAVNKTAASFIQLGFDDETTALVMAKNLGVTKDVTEAKKMLAVQADLARAKGIGLADAGQAVQMAMLGSTRVLKQLGIEVADHATKQEILAAIQERVGGTAEKASTTYKVAMERMAVQIDNVKEKLGERLLPTITQFIDKISKVVDNLNKMNPQIFDTIVKVTAIGTAFMLIGGPILLIIGFLPTLAAGFGILMTTILPIVAIIAGLAAVVFLVYEAWTNWGKIVEFIKTWLTDIENKIILTVQNIIAWFQQLPDRIMQFLYDLFFIRIPYVVGYIVGWLSVAIPELVNNVVNWFLALPPKVLEIFESVKTWIMTKITEAWTWLSTELPTWPGKIWDFIKSIPDKVKDVFENAKKAATDKMNELFKAVSDIWERIKGIFSSLQHAAEDAWNAAMKAFNAGKSAGIKGFQHGGFVPETGLAYLHQGEFVLSKDMLAGRQSVPSYVTTTHYQQPININAVINNEMDINLLGYKLAWYMRNSR